MVRILLVPKGNPCSNGQFLAEVATRKGVDKFMKGYLKRNNFASYEVISELPQIDENESTVYVSVNII